LQQSTGMKSQETTNQKALCQMILDQRSDIEQFFLESMEQVKEEKRRKLEIELAQTQSHHAPTFLPLIEPGSKFSKHNFESKVASTQQQKVTVELNDLDWADRETVLRLLFSKMNTGDPANNWRDNAESTAQDSRTSKQDENSELNKA